MQLLCQLSSDHLPRTVEDRNRHTPRPLLNVVQKFQLSYELFPVEINLSADHYHNDVSRDKSVNAFFAGLFLRWKMGSWQFTAEATNLFNKKQYSYTQYSVTESYTSWINIRPQGIYGLGAVQVLNIL